MKRFSAAILVMTLGLIGSWGVAASAERQPVPQTVAQGLALLVRTADARTRLQTTLGRFIAQNPMCREITDRCSYCVVEEGEASCSTPGIACIKADYVCSKNGPQ